MKRKLLLGGFVVLVLAASAVLLLLASTQRWVTAWEHWDRADYWVEDHRFDYFFPADPWEPIGDAAQLFGAGYALIPIALLLLAGLARGRWILAGVLGAIVAGHPFALFGIHAVWSGLLGAPSPLAGPLSAYGAPGPLAWLVDADLLGIAGLLGTAALVVALARSAAKEWIPVAVLLLPTTGLGYIVAAFGIAPMFADASYDTTRWTETVIAAWTALAALAALSALVIGAARGRTAGPLVRSDGPARLRPAR